MQALADDLDITDSEDDDDDDEWEPVHEGEDESQSHLTVTIEPQAEIQLQEEPVQMEVHYPAQEEVRRETNMHFCTVDPDDCFIKWNGVQLNLTPE